MPLKNEDPMRGAMRRAGWLDEDIDAFINGEYGVEEEMVEDEELFARFLEDNVENN